MKQHEKIAKIMRAVLSKDATILKSGAFWFEESLKTLWKMSITPEYEVIRMTHIDKFIVLFKAYIDSETEQLIKDTFNYNKLV